MKGKSSINIICVLVLCALSLCFVACSEKPHEHQTDDSGFCVYCDKAINPTKGVNYKVSSDETYAEVVGYSGESSKINIPRSSPLRVRTDTVPFSISRSPMTSI